MKCRRFVDAAPTIVAIDALEICFSRSIRISSSLPSSLDVPTGPFGRPSKRPLARAAETVDDLPSPPPTSVRRERVQDGRRHVRGWHRALIHPGEAPRHGRRCRGFLAARRRSTPLSTNLLVNRLCSAHTFMGRETAKTPHLFTEIEFTCGACITGTRKKIPICLLQLGLRVAHAQSSRPARSGVRSDICLLRLDLRVAHA